MSGAKIGSLIGAWSALLFVVLCSPGRWFMLDYSVGQALFVMVCIQALWIMSCTALGLAAELLAAGKVSHNSVKSARKLLEATSPQIRRVLMITMDGEGLSLSSGAILVEQCSLARWEQLSPECQAELIREGLVVETSAPGSRIYGAPTREAMRDSLAYKMAARTARQEGA